MGIVTQEQVVEYIAGLRLTEVQDLIHALEQALGVSASVALPTLPIIGPDPEPEIVQTEFDVVLQDCGERRMEVIKAVRKLSGLGLREARDLVESTPAVVREQLSQEEAEAIRDALREAGATAALR